MADQEHDHGESPEAPPGAWAPARELARRAIAPVERFLSIEAASGIVLLAAALVALAWANSPWRESYVALWHTPFGLRLGPWSFERDLHFWINDGLMTIFFFVVGLEIKREIHRGELSDLRRAALPLAAALGGMIAPACVYLALNPHGAPARGWGVPMATDIAFAVGALAVLGKRVPPAMRVLLLALAVIDDVGAILVIAFFYSSGIVPAGLAVAASGLVAILAMQALGIRRPAAYVAPALVIWGGAYGAGVHPTLAGVVVGLLTPVRAWLGPHRFVKRAGESVAAVRERSGESEQALLPHLDELDRARREAVSPVERLQHALHGWVAYGIMPLFALASAGVPLADASLDASSLPVFLGVLLGLALGKPIGIVAASWLCVRARVAALPRGVAWPHVSLVGVVGGIGFTMALFVAHLAFPPGALLETAKLAILAASALAAVGGFAIGRLLLPEAPAREGARTAAEAEQSTVS